MNEKISKAGNVKKVDSIYELISEELSSIDVLKYIKIYNGRIKASNEMSTNGKKEPITDEGTENITGVELLVDTPSKVIQFFSITSSVKGSGGKIVSAIVKSTPGDWKIVVLMDWSGGFWDVMKSRHPRIVII
jgi:hypothetical protein